MRAEIKVRLLLNPAALALRESIFGILTNSGVVVGIGILVHLAAVNSS
jgi:hypothetical protein